MESEQKENDFAVEDYIIAAAAGSQSFNFEGSADRPLMELQNVLISNTPLQSSSASSASSSSTSTFTSIINLSPFTNLKAYIFKFSNPAVTLLPANQSNVGPFSLLPDELLLKVLKIVDVKDLGAVSLTNRNLNKFIVGNFLLSKSGVNFLIRASQFDPSANRDRLFELFSSIGG